VKLNRRIAAVLLLVLVTALVGCTGGGGSTTPPAATPPSGSGAAPAASAPTVVEKGLAFDPSTLEVKIGDTVTFKNEDTAPHIVQIDGQDLGQQEPGASVTWTAATAGTFPYSCTIHPSMTGEIIVK
jgi:plastocyanin